jgi:hypothetical protein
MITRPIVRSIVRSIVFTLLGWTHLFTSELQLFFTATGEEFYVKEN